MRSVLALAVVSALFSTTALASPARISSLSANPGFTDESDFFVYPFALARVGDAGFLTYNGGFDAGVAWDDQALFFDRDMLLNDIVGLGPQPGWRASYFKVNDDSAWTGRVSYDPDTNKHFNLGGTWGKGTYGDDTAQDMAIGGDLFFEGGFDDLTPGLDLLAQGRDIAADKFSQWGAGAYYFDKVVRLGGTYYMGPRFTDIEGVELALGVGGGGLVTVNDGDVSADLLVPGSNIAIEYQLRDWMKLRGSATAGLTVNYNGDDVTLDTAVGGAFGAGFQHKHAQLDVTINPAWAQGGPFFLSGAGVPMFGVLSFKVDL